MNDDHNRNVEKTIFFGDMAFVLFDDGTWDMAVSGPESTSERTLDLKRHLSSEMGSDAVLEATVFNDVSLENPLDS